MMAIAKRKVGVQVTPSPLQCPTSKPWESNFSFLRFCSEHPFILTGIITLFCLWVQQEYKRLAGIGTFKENIGLGGTVVPIYTVCGIAVAVVALWAWCVFVSSTHESSWKKALYMAFGASAVFLIFRYALSCGDTATTVLCCVSASAFVALAVLMGIKRKNASVGSVFVACALLGIVPVFGVGVAMYYTVAVILIAFVCLQSKGKHMVRTSVSGVVIALTAVAAHLAYNNGETPLLSLTNAGLVLCVGALAFLAISQRNKVGYIVAVLFAAGFVIRLGYVLDITLPTNQHDVFPLSSENPRHNSYIWHIYNNWALPTEHVYERGLSQYYHPPLHHFLAALWMKIQTLLGINEYAAYENIQYLTLFYSSAMMIAADKLFKEFKLKASARIIGFAVIAFHPTFFIFAGSVNNDCLCTLFLFLAVLYTVRWYKEQSYKNTFMLAVFIGGAMMTKLSGAMVAIGTAFVILAVLFNFKNKISDNFRKLWKKGVLFVAVCFPLGLWWPIRCKLLYGMPLGFVPSMTETQQNPQYVAEYSFWERISGAGSQHFSNVYPTIGLTDFKGNAGAAEYDYGIAPYSVKSSLFGEFYNAVNVSPEQNVMARVMFFAALALILFTLAGMAFGLWASFKRNNRFLKSEHRVPLWFVVIYYVALVASYVTFCFRYQFTCTMDFRYIVPTILTGAVFTGVLLNRNTKWQKVLTVFCGVFTAVFCVASVVFYYYSFGDLPA